MSLLPDVPVTIGPLTNGFARRGTSAAHIDIHRSRIHEPAIGL
jgi:hypothetical protein